MPSPSQLRVTSARRIVVTLAAASATVAVAAATGFLDPASLLVTVGGSLAVLCLTFSRRRIESAYRHLRVALVECADPERLIVTLKRYARIHRIDGTPALERAALTADDPFLRDAVGLAVELNDCRELSDALAGELRVRVAEAEAARQVLITLGKLFPAFGLIGTLIGLVVLLRNVTGSDFASLGSGLGLAVLTTLYGAVLSNVVVLPLATKMQAHQARRTLLMRMIIEGILLVHAREYPTRVERALRAYVSDAAVEVLGDRPLPAERAA